MSSRCYHTVIRLIFTNERETWGIKLLNWIKDGLIDCLQMSKFWHSLRWKVAKLNGVTKQRKRREPDDWYRTSLGELNATLVAYRWHSTRNRICWRISGFKDYLFKRRRAAYPISTCVIAMMLSTVYSSVSTERMTPEKKSPQRM